MLETREFDKAIECLISSCEGWRSSESTAYLATSLMLLGAAHLLAQHAAEAVDALQQVREKVRERERARERQRESERGKKRERVRAQEREREHEQTREWEEE